MIKVAAKRPDERQRQIDQQRAHVAYEANSRVAAWGIEASMSMKQITGRILAPPKVQYSPKGKVKEPSVGRGQWNRAHPDPAAFCSLADAFISSHRHQVHRRQQTARALGHPVLRRSAAAAASTAPEIGRAHV